MPNEYCRGVPPFLFQNSKLIFGSMREYTNIKYLFNYTIYTITKYLDVILKKMTLSLLWIRIASINRPCLPNYAKMYINGLYYFSSKIPDGTAATVRIILELNF